MKKKLSLLLASTLIISAFAACGSTPVEEPSIDPASEPSTQGVESAPSNDQVDILVIGAGGAGMTAALQAHDEGASVLVIEKMNMAGGNTLRATGGMNAAETKFQEASEIEDTKETFYQDTMTGGDNVNDPELVRYMTDNASDAVDWLTEKGMDLSDVGAGAAASNPRLHRPTGGDKVGGALVSNLKGNLETAGVEIRLETKAIALTVDENGAVTGAKVEGPQGEYTIAATAVVLATGGFGANSDMFVQYNPELEGFVTTNHAGATGEGILLGTDAGATTVDMEQIQTHPTVVQSNGEMITEAVRGNGGILINKEGNRFTNEMGTRAAVSKEILAQPDSTSYIIFNEAVRGSLKAIESYVNQGLTVEGADVAALATALSMDPSVLGETITAYNAVIAGGTDPFGRDGTMSNPGLPTEFDFSAGPWYAIEVGPGVHHTMGGLKINTNTEVLKEDGSAIAGLYAAGEVTGGVHGANRIGGTAVTDIVVFGRQSGLGSAGYAKTHSENFGEGATLATSTAPAGDDTKKALPVSDMVYIDGEYTGTASGGKGGDVTVIVTVKDGKISGVVMGDHAETPEYLENVERDVVNDMIASNGTEHVDVFAGATLSSNAVISAVTNALESAVEETPAAA